MKLPNLGTQPIPVLGINPWTRRYKALVRVSAATLCLWGPERAVSANGLAKGN
jgi:hypothetical protein